MSEEDRLVRWYRTQGTILAAVPVILLTAMYVACLVAWLSGD